MKIAVVIADSNSACPVPASKGGAVATLVEHLVSLNNTQCLCDMTVFSYYDQKAVEMSLRYPNVNFKWVKIPKIILFFDSMFFNIITIIFRKAKAISYKHIFSLLWYVYKVSGVIKVCDYDKIVIENNMILSWVIRLRGNIRKYNGKVYYHLHNIPRTNAKNQVVFNNVKSYLCISNYVAKEICSKDSVIGPIDPNKVKIVKNAINTDLFCSTSVKQEEILKLKKQYKVKDDEVVLVFAGRLSKEKGVDIAIRTLDYLPDNYKLLIVGATLVSGKIKDDYFEKLTELVKNKQNRIVFTGYVNQKDIHNIYTLGRYAVLPSMWDEPAGLTMLEAMSCGTVVITTNSGGIPEYTNDQSSILLERTDDLPQRIAGVIRELQSDEDKYKALSLNGRINVEQNYSMNNYLVRVLSALEEE